MPILPMFSNILPKHTYIFLFGLMSTHSIYMYFNGDLEKIIPKSSSNTPP